MGSATGCRCGPSARRGRGYGWSSSALFNAGAGAYELARVDGVVRGRLRRALGLLSPRPLVLAYRIQKLREGRQVLPVSRRRRALAVGGGPRNAAWFREDFLALLELLGRTRSTRWWPSACRCPRRVARMSCWSSPPRWESPSSCHEPTGTLADGERGPGWSRRAGRVRRSSAGSAGALPAHRRARPDRRPAHRRPRRHRRDDRLVLLPTL
jgi:hypothetical protein